MKTFLQKAYVAILFILFISFIYIMKLDATSHMTLFSISLILVSALLAALPLLINNYKKIRVRNWYIISMILTSVFVTYKALYILLIKFFINNTTLVQILNLYVPAVLIAIAISASLFTVVYSFKDFFKKGYSFSKLDLQSFIMSLNSVSYLLISLFALHFSNLEIKAHYVGLSSQIDYISYEFLNDKIFNNTIFIIALVYIVLYTLIQLITYFKYEKDK